MDQVRRRLPANRVAGPISHGLFDQRSRNDRQRRLRLSDDLYLAPQFFRSTCRFRAIIPRNVINSAHYFPVEVREGRVNRALTGPRA